MLTEGDIQKLSGIKNYIKADRYRSGHRIFNVTTQTINDTNVVKALVKGVDSHEPKLVFSKESDLLLSFYCSCTVGEKEFCSHCAALALYYLDAAKSPDTTVPSEKIDPGFLPVSDISFTHDEKIYDIVILSFDRSSRDLVFLPSDRKGYGHRSFITLKVLNDTGVSVHISQNTLSSCNAITANLFEFIKENGFFNDGIYYIEQTKIDMLFALCSSCRSVYFGKDKKTLEFSDEIFKPSLIKSKNDRVTMTKDFVLINGKHTNYIYRDPVISPLPKVLTTDILNRFEKGLYINDTQKLQNYFIFKAEEEKQDVFIENPALSVNIYIKYDNGHIIIVPEVHYENIAVIRPVHFFALTGAYFGDNLIHYADMDNRRISFLRNMHIEYEVYSYFEKWSFETNIEKGHYIIAQGVGVLCLFNDVIPGFPPEWKIYYDREIEKLKPVKKELKITFEFEGNNGLLEFDVKYHLDGLRVDESTLKEALENNMLLKQDDLYIEITNEIALRRLFSLLNNFNNEAGSYSGNLYHITELFDLVENERLEYRCDEVFNKLISAISDPTAAEPAPIPDRYKTVLRNYQKEGINWMSFLFGYGFGGILADDMGLGKTLQTLVMLSMTKRSRASLIVCPKTLMFNWQKEIEKFTPGLEVLLTEGGKYLRRRNIANAGAGSILITSYPLLQRDIQLHLNKDYDFVILDEAQYIKNPDTNNAKSVKMLKAEKRLALTGTPMENSVLDLWSVFDFVMPGFLGSEQDFKSKYQREINQGDTLKVSQFKKKIRPFILRRTKGEVLKELPPKIEQVQYSSLTKEQLAFYMDMLERIRSDILSTIDTKGFNNSRIEILAGLTRLRQICNHPGLVEPLFKNRKNVSGKTDLFEELIIECTQAGHKVIVFSQFTKMLDILGQVLTQNCLDYSRLDGSTDKRNKVVEEFTENENKKVFLISLKAGGYGLNLTCADTVIIYDPWWNPMVESQASDRAHRIGQDKVVNVYSLITKNTIEEKIQFLKEKKRGLFNSIITESGDLSNQLTQEDIMELLL